MLERAGEAIGVSGEEERRRLKKPWRELPVEEVDVLGGAGAGAGSAPFPKIGIALGGSGGCRWRRDEANPKNLVCTKKNA